MRKAEEGGRNPEAITQADNAIGKTEGSGRERCKEKKGRGDELRCRCAGFERTEIHQAELSGTQM